MGKYRFLIIFFIIASLTSIVVFFIYNVNDSKIFYNQFLSKDFQWHSSPESYYTAFLVGDDQVWFVDNNYSDYIPFNYAEESFLPQKKVNSLEFKDGFTWINGQKTASPYPSNYYEKKFPSLKSEKDWYINLKANSFIHIGLNKEMPYELTLNYYDSDKSIDTKTIKSKDSISGKIEYLVNNNNVIFLFQKYDYFSSWVENRTIYQYNTKTKILQEINKLPSCLNFRLVSPSKEGFIFLSNQNLGEISFESKITITKDLTIDIHDGYFSVYPLSSDEVLLIGDVQKKPFQGICSNKAKILDLTKQKIVKEYFLHKGTCFQKMIRLSDKRILIYDGNQTNIFFDMDNMLWKKHNHIELLELT